MFKHKFFISLLVIGICVFLVNISQAAVIHAKKGESVINYRIVHPLHTVDATCKGCDCTVSYDDNSFKVTGVNVTADVLSFDSGNSNRDSHMGEVVDALDYPTVSFKSDTIKAVNQDTLWVEGELNFHNVTKPVSFKVAENFQSGETFFTGAFDISLTAFKIQRPSLLLMPVSDNLALSFKMVIPMVLKK